MSHTAGEGPDGTLGAHTFTCDAGSLDRRDRVSTQLKALCFASCVCVCVLCSVVCV